ncbi:MAG: hypothetical protein LBU81_00665 [Methanosarcinales archaeon]|nr:hypothetical protein [Methanosarcinales archaeon]
MKKSILIVLLITLLAAAAGVSGCLGGDDNGTNVSNDTPNATNDTPNATNNTPNATNNTSNATNNTSNGTDNVTNGTNNTSNVTPAASFNNSTVTVKSLPSGFELLALRSVTADKENLDGVTDALNGYSGYYGVNSTNVYLLAFQTADNTSAQGYVQSMIDAHKTQYPNSGNVSNVTVNGHSASMLLKPVTSGGTTVERCTIAWASGDKLVVVNGPGTREQVEILANASGL